MKSRSQYMAARVALFYALGACTWIAGSDFLVGITTGSGFTNVALNTGKGFLFVAATGLLLFIVLRRLLRTELEARAQAEATAKQLSEHERALQQSELLYHTIFESANDGILLLENDRFIDCNPRTLEIFRAKREQLIGLTPADLSPERQPDGRLSREIQTETNRLALADKPQVFPWQHRRTDGSSFTAEVSLRRFQLGERKLLLALVRDITERLKGEEAERLVRLQHSALQAAANAIVITDRKGDIQWVNEAFTRLTGYDRNEAIGLKPNILKSGTHGPAFYKNMWEEVLAGRVWQGELTNRRKNGTTYDEEMTITPVRSDHGDITHFIAIKQDVTERKKLEQQFLRSQRMQSIGLLAGGVAHDLNNVLTPVLLALPLLRNPLDPEERERIIESLEQSVRRGANIVQQVLTFARGVEVQRTSVQLRHLIREVARIAEETFPRDIEIRTSLPRDLWTVAGDPTQIHQVVLNLAVNARDALPNGGQLVFTGRNLELEHPRQFLDGAILPGRYVCLTVSDTGTGIAPEIAERIFEPFFTTKPAGKGTGLGLSTVLGIVKSHAGLVEVETRVGVGSNFTVYLPAESVDAAHGAAPEQSIFAQGRGETVLVVDDEEGILNITSTILQTNGYAVISAVDGRQALDKLSKTGPRVDALITDLMMPGLDGVGLAASVRKLHPKLPLIAITGLINPPGEEDRAARLRELGVQHVLRKPFSAEALLQALDEVLKVG